MSTAAERRAGRRKVRREGPASDVVNVAGWSPVEYTRALRQAAAYALGQGPCLVRSEHADLVLIRAEDFASLVLKEGEQ